MTFHFPDLRFSELAVSRLLKRGIEINGQVVESLCALERHFAEIEFELKFEITEECNLVCSFCHQEFGQRKNCSKPFALEEFRQVMEMAQKALKEPKLNDRKAVCAGRLMRGLYRNEEQKNAWECSSAPDGHDLGYRLCRAAGGDGEH